MKNIMLFAVTLSVLVLALAVAYHAETGRYQISHVNGLAGVYMVDTRTGEISICSPVNASGCITLAEAHRHIVQQRQNVVDSAQKATDRIDQFTKDRARELRGVIQKLRPDGTPEEEAPSAQE